MIHPRIPCLLFLSIAVTVACTEGGAGGHEAEATTEVEAIEPAQVQQAIEQALDEADAEITPANAEDELRKLEDEIKADG